MSNRVTIQPTKFENTRTGEISVGVRVFDNYGQSYDNTWESIPDDDIDVIARLIESEDFAIVAMLNWILENYAGIYVGDIYYTWKQIKHLWYEVDEILE